MEIYYGDGNIRFEGSLLSINDIAAFEIKYKGLIEIESKLPSGWLLDMNANKIIGVSMGKNISNPIMTYEGELKIISCLFVSKDLKTEYARVVAENLGYAYNMATTFADQSKKAEELTGNYIYGKIPSKTKIKHNNNVDLKETEVEKVNIQPRTDRETGGY